MLRPVFKKVAGLKACEFIKKRLQNRLFPVNFAKFVRTPILKNISKQLVLNFDPKRAVTFSQVTCTMLSWSAWANIAHENYLCDVCPQSTNSFAQEHNLQCLLDLSGPTLNKEIICAMLAHSWQTTLIRKITYIMLCQPCWDNIA